MTRTLAFCKEGLFFFFFLFLLFDKCVSVAICVPVCGLSLSCGGCLEVGCEFSATLPFSTHAIPCSVMRHPPKLSPPRTPPTSHFKGFFEIFVGLGSPNFVGRIDSMMFFFSLSGTSPIFNSQYRLIRAPPEGRPPILKRIFETLAPLFCDDTFLPSVSERDPQPSQVPPPSFYPLKML